MKNGALDLDDFQAMMEKLSRNTKPRIIEYYSQRLYDTDPAYRAWIDGRKGPEYGEDNNAPSDSKRERKRN